MKYVRPDVVALLPFAEEWILEACSSRVDDAQAAVFLVEARRLGRRRLPRAPEPREITRRVVIGALRDLERGLLARVCVVP